MYLDQGTVALGTTAQPYLYHGEVVALEGNDIVADVRGDSTSGLELVMRLSVDHGSGHVAGTIRAVAAQRGTSDREGAADD